MSRAPELEAILVVWYELDTGNPAHAESLKAKLNQLLDASIAKSGKEGMNRQQLMTILEGSYREFARAKRIEERQRLSRLR